MIVPRLARLQLRRLSLLTSTSTLTHASCEAGFKEVKSMF